MLVSYKQPQRQQTQSIQKERQQKKALLKGFYTIAKNETKLSITLTIKML
jgi:hypothetical protein